MRARGFTVTSAPAEGTVGVSDEDQLAYAAQHDVVILSHNRRHFLRWHARWATAGRPHAGIVILPQTSVLPQLTVRAAMMLDWIAGQGEWRSRLFLWGDLQRRFTQDFRLGGYSEAEIRLALGQQE
ncbi:MAG: DUF5615 family PIN-like protein [Chloroflexi bacterium]|nr:DUF5615 family PIN-like protein [Chloroflexota bacterium]